MSSSVYDVIIIGGGPAGWAFAKNISAQYKVLLVDRANGRGKCCGGLLAPDAQKMLAGFDIGIPRKIISDPQLFYVRAHDLKTGKYCSYQRHYTNVDRAKLDGYLLETLPQTVKIMKNAVYKGHTTQKNIVTVTIASGETREDYQCRLLVGADGANSQVRKTEFNDFKQIKKYLAIQGEYEKKSSINHFGVFFDSRITDYYSWLIPKDDTILIGGAFAEHGSPREKFKKLLQGVESLGYPLGKRVSINACYLIRPRLRDIKTGRARVALIGEAAGFISPSSAEGISYAYRSAVALAKASENTLDGWNIRYSKFVLTLKFNVFIKSIKGIFMYGAALRNLIFRLRIGSIKINS